MFLNNQKGFTLFELLMTIAVISVVVAVAVPQYTAYKTRAYDTNTQSTLKSLFTTCQDYWTFNGSTNPCVLTAVSDNEYGFTPSTTVEITIDSDANNTEYDFYATAHHTSSSSIFAIDYRGIVSRVGGGSGNNGNDDDDENNGGNNGNGCSDEAQSDPHSLGGNAAGGCGTSGGNNGNGNGGNNGNGNGNGNGGGN